jgi:hypothetical protein
VVTVTEEPREITNAGGPQQPSLPTN